MQVLTSCSGFFCTVQPMNVPALSVLWLVLLTHMLMGHPGNDDFAGRKTLPSLDSLEESIGSVPSLSYEALDPLLAAPIQGGQDRVGSLWWEWMAPRDGWFLAGCQTAESVAGAETHVFTGDALQTLVRVRNGNRNRLTHDRQTFFEARAGARYQIAVRLQLRVYPTPQDLVAPVLKIVPCPPPPPNDTLQRRAVLSGPLPISMVVSNAAPPSRELHLLESMTRVGDWYRFSDGDGPVQWWEWTCPESGNYVLQLEGTPVFALAAKRRMITAGVLGPPGDWEPNGIELRGAGFVATAGSVYDLAVRTAHPADAEGIEVFKPYTMVLNRGGSAEPPNTTKENAVAMPASLPSISRTSWTRTLTAQQDSEVLPLWYSFTAPEDGLYYFFNSVFSTELHLEPGRNWSGSMMQFLSTGERVFLEARLPRFAFAGSDMKVAFSVGAMLAGKIAGNDMLAAALELGSSDTIQLAGDRRFATLEPGERAPLAGAGFTGSMWWKWAAPADGWLRHQGGIGNATVEVITGLDAAAGVLRRFSSRSLTVEAGQSYLLRVLLSDDPDLESCALALDFFPRPRNLTWETAMDLGVTLEPSWSVRDPFPAVGAANAQWFKWTPAENGNFDLYWRHESFKLFSDPAANIEVPKSSVSGTWALEGGRPYWIRFGNGWSDEWFDVTKEELAEHGDITTAFVLNPELPAAGASVARGDTNSPAEIALLNRYIPGLQDSQKAIIWWKWKSPRRQSVRCAVEDAHYPMDYLFIFAGDTPANDVIPLTSPLDSKGNYFVAEEAETYWFAVAADGDSANSAMTFRLELRAVESGSPANDAFANSTDFGIDRWEDREPVPAIHQLTGGLNPWRYEMLQSSFEPGEPPLMPVSGANGGVIPQTGSIWWHWIAPRDGVYKLELLQYSPFEANSDEPGTPAPDVTLDFFTGAALSSLDPVFTYKPTRGEYCFRAQRGVRYSIRAAAGNLTPFFGLLSSQPLLHELYNFRAIERGEFDLLGFEDFIDHTDGITNLRKVLFGMNPRYHADHPENLAAHANLPRQVLKSGTLAMQCRPDPSMIPEGYPSRLNLLGEVSDDYVDWNFIYPEDDPSGELLLQVPIEENGRRRYLRWNALGR